MDIHHQVRKLLSMLMLLRGKATMLCHASAFVISGLVWWVFPSTIYIESMYMVAISTYIIIFNHSRREILPAMFIILVAYLVRWPLSYQLYGRDIYQQFAHFGFYFVFNVVLSLLLFKYHCHPRLQQFFGVQFARPWIPQVLAICMILSVGAIGVLCVMAELMAYWVHPGWFSQTVPPFFYGIHQYTSAVFSCLMIIGVWSMM